MAEQIRILAVASGGGHWEQMLLLRDAFVGHKVQYVTTMSGLGERAGLTGVKVLPECNRNQRVLALWCLVQVVFRILVTRPHVIISTGALPGLFAIAIGKKLGARTVWVDSIANAEEFSMSGALARPHAHMWLSQWPAVAEANDAEYAGSVL